MLSVLAEIGEEEVRMLVAGARTRQDTSGRVVGLRGGWNYGGFQNGMRVVSSLS